MDIKFQVFQGTANTSDFRGDKRLGADTDPVDRHKTLFEYRIPDELGDEAVRRLDNLNTLIAEELEDAKIALPEDLAGLVLGGDGPIRLGFRVYDND